MVIAHLFEAAKIINSAADGNTRLSQADIDSIRKAFEEMLGAVLGVKLSNNESAANLAPYEGAVDLLMQIRANAKQNKDWTTSDLIRDKLAELGFDVKDTKNGVEWSLK